jgi:hypothetical protein
MLTATSGGVSEVGVLRMFSKAIGVRSTSFFEGMSLEGVGIRRGGLSLSGVVTSVSTASPALDELLAEEEELHLAVAFVVAVVPAVSVGARCLKRFAGVSGGVASASIGRLRPLGVTSGVGESTACEPLEGFMRELPDFLFEILGRRTGVTEDVLDESPTLSPLTLRLRNE